MNSMLEQLKEWLDDPENIERWKKEEEQKENIRSHQFNKVYQFINSLNNTDFNIWFNKFIKWEEKIEEQYYQKGILNHSNIFGILIDIWQENGVEIEVDEDFCWSAFFKDGYTLKEYQGQGCFYRIVNENNEIVFQTT